MSRLVYEQVYWSFVLVIIVIIFDIYEPILRVATTPSFYSLKNRAELKSKQEE